MVLNKFGQRLLFFIQTLDFSQAKFARSIDFNIQMLNRYCKGSVFPGNDFLLKLKEHYPSLNLDLLITGQNNMYFPDNMHIGYNEKTMNIFENTYKEFEENRKINELDSLLLNATLEKSIISTYKNIHTSKIFWGVLVNNRQQIVSLLLLQRILKVAIKDKSFIGVTKENAKKVLIDIFKRYTLVLFDRALHFITTKEKEIAIDDLEKDLTDEDALKILQNIPTALKKINVHLAYRRSMKA